MGDLQDTWRRKPTTHRGWMALAVAGCSSILGCGPLVGGVEIVNAKDALQAARDAGAEAAARYEYTAARTYLTKAREEYSYSDYGAAKTFAARALELAVQARELAEAAARIPEPPAPPSP